MKAYIKASGTVLSGYLKALDKLGSKEFRVGPYLIELISIIAKKGTPWEIIVLAASLVSVPFFAIFCSTNKLAYVPFLVVNGAWWAFFFVNVADTRERGSYAFRRS